MQDAHQRARRHSPLAMLWLALAFFAWLTGSFPGDPFPVSMDSSGSQWLVDVPGEQGLDSGTGRGPALALVVPARASAVVSSHRGPTLAHSACFPVRPQAPPVA
ncbi:hypothetical protein [Marinobacter lutaoensis]|jgi:hypothetical protein|uniref:hypothetical protein n=1 Tax=Marinobacter lutaoensis TaxID=135739 RepID=UPI0015944B79|nr:hypothetical protein [Marinobacter lutaoensis]NVD34180.1 hypothetical protein [Marinobacter lutaoensis]